MKKLCVLSMVYILTSCGNSENNTATGNSDSVGLTNPVSMDTLKHPSGVDNSSVISTDTAAMRVHPIPDKEDSSKVNKP